MTPSPGTAPQIVDFCDNPGCREKFSSQDRRIQDLEDALRSQGGLYDTLTQLRLQFERFTATVTASVKTTVFLGSAGGAVVGALFGAGVAIAIALVKKG